MPHTQMSVEEAAEYLHLSAQQVEKLARQGEFPVRYVKGRSVFSKRELHDWLSQRFVGADSAPAESFHQASRQLQPGAAGEAAFLSQYLTAATCVPDLQVKTRARLLRSLVEVAAATNLVTDDRELLALLEEREALCPTGLLGGVALPHSRVHGEYLILDSFLVVARVPGGVPFGSADGHLTDLFIMPCASNDRVHLQMLARLAMLLQQTDLAEALRAAASATEMVATFNRIETEFVSTMQPTDG